MTSVEVEVDVGDDLGCPDVDPSDRSVEIVDLEPTANTC
jgi:hypothetical protein